MSPSLEYLERCAAETGFQVIPIEKVVRLGEVAADVASHPFLGEALALKGGTALNLCFGPPQRLSVDLDYNYIAHLERAQMLEDRPRVERALADLARRRGYRVQQSADTFAGRKLYLRYRSVLGQDDTVELDLNYLFRLPLDGTEILSVWQPGELDRPHVRVVVMAELVAGKLLALLDRGAPRDLWDVAHLPGRAAGEMRTPQFRAWFVALSAVLERPLASYGRERVESRVTDRSVAEQIRPLVAVATPPAHELVERAWAVVGPLLNLREREEAYLEAIQQGELRPGFLFPDNPEEAAKIAAHPAIQWKVRNVRIHRNRQGGGTDPSANQDQGG